MLDFLIKHVFWVAIVAWVLGASTDGYIRRKNNVRTALLHNIAMGGGGATHFVMMFLFGVTLLFDSEKANILQTDNTQLLGVATLMGAGSLVWLYFTGDPYSPPKASIGQRLLKVLGYYTGDVDGHCGVMTRKSLKRFLTDVINEKHGQRAYERSQLMPWVAKRIRKGDIENKKAPKMSNAAILVTTEAVIEKINSTQSPPPK